MWQKSCKLNAVRLLFLLALLAWPFQASAQMTIGQIQITGIDYNRFPDVTVQAIIRDGNGDPMPVDDLSNIELLEDGAAVSGSTYRAEQISAGVEVMFVLDLGIGIASNGYTSKLSGQGRNKRFEEMQLVVHNYLSNMRAEDWAGIITVQPELSPTVNYLQPLTSDEQLLSEKMKNLKAAPKTPMSAAEGIKQAINELSSAQAHKSSMTQAIIFLSSGRALEDSKAVALANQARDAGITIHSVMISDSKTTMGAMSKLSSGSGGSYTHYEGDSSLTAISDWVAAQRAQYRFSYRSTSNSTEQREVILRSKGTGLGQISATDHYQVKLQPPLVEIVSPVKDEEYLRRAESSDADLSTIPPTEATIQARVSWPDGYTRKLRQVQLWIDGSPYGAAVSDIPNQGNIQFTWDLSSYSSEGTFLPQIQVQAEDELQLSLTSTPVTVKVTVALPQAQVVATPGGPTPTPAPPPSKCYGLQGLQLAACRANDVAGLFSLVVALVALALVIVFRTRLTGAAVQVGDAVRQTIARMTRPPQTEIGAYLTVVRGAEDLPRNRFPIYVNTVTPIGRDKRQAELVFDENADRSVVSRIHCEITESGGRFTIRDLGSSHGTYINNERLPELTIRELCNGDLIELGPVERGGIQLNFELSGDSGPYGMPPKGMPPMDDLPDRQTEPADFSDQ